MKILKSWGDAVQLLVTRDELAHLYSATCSLVGRIQSDTPDGRCPPELWDAYLKLGDAQSRMTRARASWMKDRPFLWQNRKVLT